MNKKKTLSIILCSILLISVGSTISTTVTAADPTSLRGFVYVDEVITTPYQVKVSFSTNEYYAYLPRSPIGFYVLDVQEDIGETGSFFVTISGSTWQANESVVIDGTIVIYSNISIYTSKDPIVEDDTEPPSKVTDLTVINAKNGKLNLAWNPATDNVAVSHYNIYRDDVLITTSSGTSHQDSGLTNGVTYTYQVSAVDTSGNEGEKSDIAMATINDNDPLLIKLIYPVGGETLSEKITVEWVAIDDDFPGGELINLPIYLFYKESNNNTWFQINEILPNTGEYEWNTTSLPDGNYQLLIEAEDINNNIAHNQSDPFQIKNHEVPSENQAPNKPSRPSGPYKGKAGEKYTYETSTDDPDADQLFFIWNWGDDTDSGWLGPFESGETVNASHIWENKDDYNIRVKARDNNGAESSWSEPLSISMPRDKPFLINSLMEWLMEHFPILYQIFQKLLVLIN